MNISSNFQFFLHFTDFFLSFNPEYKHEHKTASIEKKTLSEILSELDST